MKTTDNSSPADSPRDREGGEVIRDHPSTGHWRGRPDVAGGSKAESAAPVEPAIPLAPRIAARDINRVMQRLEGQVSKIFCLLTDGGQKEFSPNLADMRHTSLGELLKRQGIAPEQLEHVVFVHQSPRTGTGEQHIIPSSAMGDTLAEHLAKGGRASAGPDMLERVSANYARMKGLEKAGVALSLCAAAFCYYQSIAGFREAIHKDPQSGKISPQWNQMTYAALSGVMGTMMALGAAMSLTQNRIR